MIYFILYWEFCRIGLFCVGGGYASLPLLKQVVVEQYGWLSTSQFLDVFAISQMTPGPIGINAATFIGTHVAGMGGAIAATIGFVTPSFILGITLARLLQKYHHLAAINGILNGLRPAVIALIATAFCSFLCATLWQQETLPSPLSVPHIGNIILLVLTALFAHRYHNVILLLGFSGLCGLILGLCGLFP